MIAADIDIARTRRVREAMTITAHGEDTWTGDMLIPPVGKCLMLRPFQDTPEWDTTFNSHYARKSLSDFETFAGVSLDTLTDEWGVNQRKGSGDYYLENFGSTNYAVFTKTSQPRNRPFFLEWYVPHGRGAAEETCMECGWGTPHAADTVSLRFLTSGQCQVWLGDYLQAVYSISDMESDMRRWRPGDTIATGPRGAIIGKLTRAFLVPVPPRQLLVWTNAGGGFTHAFESMPQTGINTITTAGRFWWRVAQGKASVQCAPLAFPESGYALRSPDELPVPPPLLSDTDWEWNVVGAWSGYGFLQSATVSLADSSGIPFVANGTARAPRLRLDLTGDGSNTPYVFYATATLPSALATTDDSEQTDIADHTRKLSLSVGREGNARGTLLIGDKESLDVAGIRTQSNRPLQLRVSAPSADLTDATTLLIGATGTPSTQQVQTDVEGTGVPITIPFTDLSSQLERAIWQHNSLPFDGWLLTEAVHELLYQAGIDVSERDIEDSTLPIPFSWSLPLEIKYQPKAGDSVLKWLGQLHKDFAPTWYMGFYPTATGTKFRFCSKEHLGTTPKATIWLHRDDTSGRTAARDFKEDVLPPEATRITVYGFDPGTRTFMRAGWVNSSLEDPTLAPSDRPVGWRGECEPLVIVDERLTTASSVYETLNLFVDRVATVLNSAQWKSDLLVDADGVPLWVGDVVRVKTQAGTTHGDYRIESISLDLRREVWRDCSYAGVKI